MSLPLLCVPDFKNSSQQDSFSPSQLLKEAQEDAELDKIAVQEQDQTGFPPSAHVLVVFLK